jgi:hypothetical protein
MPSNYGPIVSAWDVEQAVRDTLKAWIDTFLGEKERQSAGRWSPRQIQRPRSWFIQSAFHDILSSYSRSSTSSRPRRPAGTPTVAAWTASGR